MRTQALALLTNALLILTATTLAMPSTSNHDSYQEIMPTDQIALPYGASIAPISQAIQQRIVGKSWRETCPIPLADLRYLRLPYWGYDDQAHLGEMIVHKKVALEVVAIFTELFEAKFPIETMRLIDDYFEPNKTNSEIDEISMTANNTSAFFFRFIGNSHIISEHGLGTAIDINPRVNPFVRGTMVCPSVSKAYSDRTLKGVKGFLTTDNVCVLAFAKYGWHWAGSWKRVQDYQHFCKVQNESRQ